MSSKFRIGQIVRTVSLDNSSATDDMRAVHRKRENLEVVKHIGSGYYRCHHPSFVHPAHQVDGLYTWQYHETDLRAAFSSMEELDTALFQGEINDEQYLEGMKHVV